MRRRLRRTGPGRKTMWMSAMQSACVERVATTDCNLFDEDPQAFPPEVFSLVIVPPSGDVGVVREAGEVTAIRLVGDITLTGMFNAITTGVAGDFGGVLSFHMGVLFADADPFTGSILAPPQSPAISADAETKDWLWRYHTTMLLPTTTRAGADLFYGRGYATKDVHLDVTVKRKLRRDEGLWLVINVLTEEYLNQNYIPSYIAGLTANVRQLVVLP